MSNLTAFLAPITETEEAEVIISKRFVKRDADGKPILDEDGNYIPAPFRIRGMTQEENSKLVRQSTHTVKRGGKAVSELDNDEYSRRVVVLATIEPNFRATEMCSAYGVLDPMDVPLKMLNPGEFMRLGNAIAALSGLDEDSEELEGAAVKN